MPRKQRCGGGERGRRPRRVWYAKRAGVSSSTILRGVTSKTCLELTDKVGLIMTSNQKINKSKFVH